MRCRKPLEEQTGLVDLLVGEQSAEQRLRLLPDRTGAVELACVQRLGGLGADLTERRLHTQPVSREREQHERCSQPPHYAPSFFCTNILPQSSSVIRKTSSGRSPLFLSRLTTASRSSRSRPSERSTICPSEMTTSGSPVSFGERDSISAVTGCCCG